MKRSALGTSVIVAALVGLGAAACAGIVGADFGDVHALTDAGLVELDAPGIPPVPDSAVVAPPDSSIPVNEAGSCPTGLTACLVGTADSCIDLTSNPSHCKACGTACPTDPHGTAVCLASGCSFSCGTGYELCASGSGCCAIPDAGTADTGVPPAATIPCGNTPCSPLSGGFCCGANNGDDDDDGDGDVCGTAATANQLDCNYEFFCGSADQCATGQVCCFDDNPYDPQGDTNGHSSLCQATCSGHNYAQFCDPTKTGECLNGTACSATNTYTGDNDELKTTYYVCQ